MHSAWDTAILNMEIMFVIILFLSIVAGLSILWPLLACEKALFKGYWMFRQHILVLVNEKFKLSFNYNPRNAPTAWSWWCNLGFLEIRKIRRFRGKRDELLLNSREDN